MTELTKEQRQAVYDYWCEEAATVQSTADYYDLPFELVNRIIEEFI